MPHGSGVEQLLSRSGTVPFPYFCVRAFFDSLRVMFLLHEYLLAQAKPAELQAYDSMREWNSHAALNTAANIMADVARLYLQGKRNLDTLPLCWRYNCRVAIKYIRNSGCNNTDEALKTLTPLLLIESIFQKRWTFDIDKNSAQTLDPKFGVPTQPIVGIHGEGRIPAGSSWFRPTQGPSRV